MRGGNPCLPPPFRLIACAVNQLRPCDRAASVGWKSAQGSYAGAGNRVGKCFRFQKQRHYALLDRSLAVSLLP